MEDGNEQDLSSVPTTSPLSDRNYEERLDELTNAVQELQLNLSRRQREITENKAEIDELKQQAAVYKMDIEERNKIIKELTDIIENQKAIIENQEKIVEHGRPQDLKKIAELELQLKEERKLRRELQKTVYK